MARISFTAIVDEIIGKLGGSVFQYSQGGYQVHVIGKPRNPQTKYQQLRRGDFGFLSASWRGLTISQRQTFIDNAPAGISPINFFVQQNVNLILIEEPTITSYVPTSTPDVMPCEIMNANPTEYDIKATGAITIVPAGQKLLIFTTSEKEQTKIFTNPSEYSPIISFDEGTNLSTLTSILTAYQNRFGQITDEKYLCIKSVLIDKTNGNRGADSINCANTPTMANYYLRLASFLNASNRAIPGSNIAYSYNIPANTLTENGDVVLANYSGTYDVAGAGNNFYIDYNGNIVNLPVDLTVNPVTIEVKITRMAVNTVNVKIKGTVNGVVTFINFAQYAAQNFAAIINLSLGITASAGSSITAQDGTIDMVQQSL